MGIYHYGGSTRYVAPSTVYRMLRDMGATAQEAAILTSIAGAESSFYSSIVNDSALGVRELSVGLLQINLDAHQGASIPGGGTVSQSTMANASSNLAYGLKLLRSSGARPWSAALNGAYRSHLSAAESAARAYGDSMSSSQIDSAMVASLGGQPTPGVGGTINPQNAGGTTDAGGSTGPAGEPLGTPDTFLGGGTLYKDGETFVLRFQVARGVFIEWSTTDTEALTRSGYVPGQALAYTGVDEGQYLVGYEEAGDASELADLDEAGYDSLSKFFEDTIYQFFSPYDPAIKTDEIQAIIARIMANPDVGEATIQGWIRQTEWWAQHNDSQREWNGLSPGEQERRALEQARLLGQEFYRLTGKDIEIGSDRLMKWARLVASGEQTFGQISQLFKNYAERDPESPYSRQLRDEQIERGQYQSDVGNQTEQVRQLSREWGLNLSDERAAKFAEAIVRNEMSIGELVGRFRAQANALYPHKDPEVLTSDWAEPYMQAYQRIMEVGETSILDRDIQQALQKGWNLNDFETHLRRDPRWMATDNARQSLVATFGEVGQRMGFL